MRLTPAHAVQLARLAAGGSLPKSRLSKVLLPTLQTADVVRLEQSGSSYLVRGIPGKLEQFVEHRWGIRDLKSFAQANPVTRSRESLSEIAGDSKALRNHPLAGLFIRSFGNCFLQGQPLAVTPPGSAIFVSPSQLPTLEIRASTLIAIENPACLLNFERALRHFPNLELNDTALVLRWSWGSAWKEWIRRWPGRLFHFPDYDPAGLRIFASELLPHRPDARLLIPENLETMLKRGSRNLYLRQEALLSRLNDHPQIRAVADSLRASRRALEQESLLALPKLAGRRS
jgi:hypothetical protein